MSAFDNEGDNHASVRGHEMATDTTMGGVLDHALIHCCACWKYTDDMRAQAELTRDAVTIVCNGSTLAVEKSEAWAAADKFLAARFTASGPPRMPRF